MLSWFSVASGSRQSAWICASAEAAASGSACTTAIRSSCRTTFTPGNFSAACCVGLRQDRAVNRRAQNARIKHIREAGCRRRIWPIR